MDKLHYEVVNDQIDQAIKDIDEVIETNVTISEDLEKIRLENQELRSLIKNLYLFLKYEDRLTENENKLYQMLVLKVKDFGI